MAAADRDFHKQAKHLRPIATAPFYAIDLRMVGNPYWPTPMMSLGGLKVQHHPLCAIESDLHAICTPPHANYILYLRAAVGLPIHFQVDGRSGAVLDATAAAAPIDGLFAAGRCAASVCSNVYISGT